ncbi:ARM repeat-containing protein [Xylariaceae sp. FL1651]|nr:ARM repeat-containing protein [Xylariaceae sp. FL1651]
MLSGAIDRLFDSIPNDEALQTEVLRQVANVARNLWETEPESPDLDSIAEKVGDAARTESKRIPIGESGVLDFFCSVVSTQGVRSTLIVQSLRIIGNSCADEDENRARVVASGCVPSLVSLLNDDSLHAFNIPVLFNICVDYEPAQRAIYQAGINPELISLMSSSRLQSAVSFMNIICKLLGLVATQEPEANLVHPATPFVLLSLANSHSLPIDTEDFLGQASVALTYLSQDQFQQTFLETPGSINIILQVFSKACGGFDISQIDREDQAQLKQIQTAFTATLADLSAQPLFASSCTLDSLEVQMLQRWISTPYIPLQSAACLMLGNIARSDEKCSYLVQHSAIHVPLIAILTDPTNVDAGLLHSVLSFLKNLAIPTGNKAMLGNAGLLETHVLPRIWDLDTQPQVQFDAVSLTRLLLVSCPANVRRICAPLSEDPASPAHDRSTLHLLMDLNTRSDHEPTKMETARAVMTVCRVLHSSPVSPLPPTIELTTNPSSPSTSSNPSSDPSVITPTSTSISAIAPDDSSRPSSFISGADPRTSLEAFYANHRMITNAMLCLGMQSKFPVLRSELLFVFALMARTLEGATMVARSMHRVEFVGVIVEVITGEKVIPDPNSGEEGQQPNSVALEPDAESPVSDHTSSSATVSSSDIGRVAGLEVRAPAQQLPASGANTAAAAKEVQKSMQDVDRENALVLIAELLQRCRHELLPLPRRTFKRLLQQAGQQLLQKRGEKGSVDPEEDKTK